MARMEAPRGLDLAARRVPVRAGTPPRASKRPLHASASLAKRTR